MVEAAEVVDMEAVVVVAVATVAAAVAMEVVATEVDVVVEDMVEVVATRPPLDQDHLQKKHFQFKISIHAYLVLFCYAVLSIQNCIFSAFEIGPLQLNSPKLQSKTL